MRRLIAIGAGIVCLASARFVYSAPASDVTSDVVMEDGTVRTVRQRGDEFFNWTEDGQGFAVARGGDGRWQYATRGKGRWVPSGMAPQQRGLEGRRLDPPAHVSPFDGAAAAEALSATPAAPLASTPAPAKLLVVLVAFADRSLTYPAGEWTNKFFGASGKTINTYYRQASKERFWFNPAEETEGATNDGVVSVTLAINHPNTSATDDTVRNAVKQALIAADPHINYKAFDTDNNSTLSTSELHLVLVFAGYEYAYSSSYAPYVWAHRWALFVPVSAPVLDGVYVASSSGSGGYMAVGEAHTTHAATIGVICHELGHNLGLPDLYDTDGSSDGVGTHCLMGNGNWGRAYGEAFQGQTPVLPSAYCRQAIVFSDVQVAAGEGEVYALTQVSDSTNVTDMVRLNTPDSQQFYLVENRRLAGFDAGLYFYLGASSGGGLAVWHIDTSVSANTDDARRLVDLEEAALPVLDVAGAYYGRVQNYYYSNNVTRFDATTFPSNILNGGERGLARVYSVSAPGAQMTFSCEDGVSLQAAVDVPATQAFASGGSAVWIDQGELTHDGRDAAQSGTVSKFATLSWMSTEVTGPAQAAFWWKHNASASETLTLLVDGLPHVSTGITDWTRVSLDLGEGPHALRWEFATTRKSGTSNGAYVDQLAVTPLAAVLAVESPVLSFPWTGGAAQIAVRNEGNAALTWQAAPSVPWCSVWPASGVLDAGATQQVAVVCATNPVWKVGRSGLLSVTGADPFGRPAAGSPVELSLQQEGRPPNPATVFSVR